MGTDDFGRDVFSRIIHGARMFYRLYAGIFRSLPDDVAIAA